MNSQQLIENLQSLTGAQAWLIAAIFVFVICTILTLITFRQFNAHQDNFKDNDLAKHPEGILLDIENCTSNSRYIITEKPVMIGRVETQESDYYNSIVIPDSTIGRRHATVEFENGNFWLEDQGSVNGCHINGRRIHGRHQLKDGDFVKIHKFVFQFIERYVYSKEVDSNDVTTEILPQQNFPPRMPSLNMETNSLKPNDTLKPHAEQLELDESSDLSTPVHKHEVTQVLLRPAYKPKPETKNESVDEGDKTVRLFNSTNDEKTMRLFSETLEGPPLKLSELDGNEVIANMRMSDSIPPDINEKVMEALGDFFSDEIDEPEELSSVEITKKGEHLLKMDHFTHYSPRADLLSDKSSKD